MRRLLLRETLPDLLAAHHRFIKLSSGPTRLFLKSTTTQMPPAFERGLLSFFSPFAGAGIQIVVGAPPPQPDADWARIHLLVVDPEYFGKIRVLLYNLRHGVDEEPA